MVHPYLRRRNGQGEGRASLTRTAARPRRVEACARQDLRRAAVPGTGDEARHRRGQLLARRGQRSPPRDGDVPQCRHDPQVRGEDDRRHGRRAATNAISPSAASSRSRASAATAFPKAMPQSFARLVYVSAWIKCHHPAVFACALLNSQPMGFYAPAQIVRDAREHDVEVRPVDVNASDWDNSLERREGRRARAAARLPADRRLPRGMGRAYRRGARVARLSPASRRLRRARDLPSRALRLLADADACRSIGLDRREALWDVRRTPGDALPLFAAADARELGEEPDAALPAMPLAEHVVADYQTTAAVAEGASDGVPARPFPRRGRAELRRDFRGEERRAGAHGRDRAHPPAPGQGQCDLRRRSRTRPGSPTCFSGRGMFERYRRPVMAVAPDAGRGRGAAQRRGRRPSDGVADHRPHRRPGAPVRGQAARADALALRRGASSRASARRPHPAEISGFSLSIRWSFIGLAFACEVD